VVYDLIHGIGRGLGVYGGGVLFLGAHCHIRVFFFCAVSGLVNTVYDIHIHIHIHTRVIEFLSSTVLSVYRIF
jgi:hypothetical protein